MANRTLPAKRKAISKRMRFEIFARDNFTCRYCGRQSDEVKLVIDHITPVCEGGLTERENLLTACHDCNAGKAGKPISQHVPTETDRLRLAQEHQEQLQALAQAREMAAATEEIRQEIINYVCSAFSAPSMMRTDARLLLSFLRQHGAIVYQWINIAAERVPVNVVGKYVSGIRRRWLLEQGGEL